MRARNIKPGFFTNDALGVLEPLTRILFVGLWCAADREGRLEDRPLRLKVSILPYDSCDVDVMLESLAEAGLIVRYQVQGNRFISIPNFLKHQKPHTKEIASTIPGHTQAVASNDLGDGEHALIPDSLIPDSLIPDSLPSSYSKTHKTQVAAASETTQQPPIVEAWNQLVPEIHRRSDDAAWVVALQRTTNVNVTVELGKAQRYLMGKPSKAPAKDWRRFVANWVNRAVSNGPVNEADLDPPATVEQLDAKIAEMQGFLDRAVDSKFRAALQRTLAQVTSNRRAITDG